MKLIITDVTLDVVRRDPETTLRAGGDHHGSAQTYGVLRIQTGDGIEGNCIVGERWGRPESYFGPIITAL